MNENWNIRLSFVLPFYNVEQYIVECLDSIYACSLSEDEYEVICVDDCSPDSSCVLVEEYGKGHRNLRIVKHDHNKRLGGGRNTGISNARGRYVWFIDTDDQVVPEKVQDVLRIAENNGLDVLSFNFCRFGEDGIEDRYDYHSSEVMSGPDYVGQIMGKRVITYNGFAWRHIYSTVFLRDKGLLFPENVFWEDTVFVIDAIYKASRTMSVEDVDIVTERMGRQLRSILLRGRVLIGALSQGMNGISLVPRFTTQLFRLQYVMMPIVDICDIGCTGRLYQISHIVKISCRWLLGRRSTLFFRMIKSVCLLNC